MNLHKSNTSLRFPLIIGGLSAAAGIVYLYYQLSRKPKDGLHLTPEQVKQILREFKRDYYPILRSLSTVSLNIQEDYRRRLGYLPENLKDSLNVILVDENPAFKEQIAAMENRIYSKHNVQDKAAFESLASKLAVSDPDIRLLVDEINEAFNAAVRGMKTNDKVSLPADVTPELVLEAYKESIKAVLTTLLTFIRDYKEMHGEINPDDQAFAAQLKDLKIDALKIEVLARKGLDLSSEYHVERIFDYAISEYSKNVQGFRQQIGKLDQLNQSLRMRAFGPGADVTALLSELSSLDSIKLKEDTATRENKLNDHYNDTDDVKESSVPKRADEDNQDLEVSNSPIDREAKTKDPDYSDLRNEDSRKNSSRGDEEETIPKERLDVVDVDIEEETQREEVHVEPVSWININNDKSSSQDFIEADEPLSDDKILTTSTLRDPNQPVITIVDTDSYNDGDFEIMKENDQA